MKKHSLYFIFILNFLCQNIAQAQSVSFGYQQVPSFLADNNDTLILPLMGGFNCPQFSTMKLNDDDMEDLVVFERTNSKIYTFLAENKNGQWKYIYKPDYESFFPKCENWFFLRDYNCDGKKDIFTSAIPGIRLYKNNMVVAGQLAFDVVSNALQSTSFSGNPLNLTVDAGDIPSIIDLDGDGDLDVVTFEFAGSTIEWHQNMSKENTGGCEGITFRKNGCWGQVAKAAACGEFLTGVVCKGDGGRLAANQGPIQKPVGTYHNGAAILVLNLDGDADFDLLTGEYHCNKMTALSNIGGAVTANAEMTTPQYGFPSENSADFHIFPAAYHEDLNFDGKRDLIIAPNTYNNDENLMDFRNSAWFYANTATANAPHFIWQQNNFLQSQSIDLGEEATPVFVDFDRDGDLDMFVGNRGIRTTTGFYASVYQYENVGTPQKAVFKLINSDYLNISNLGLRNIKPCFAQLNADNAPDFVFSGVSGNLNKLYYFLNTATTGTFAFAGGTPLTLSVPFNLGDSPTFADLNGDGLSDLLIGRGNDKIARFNNIGSIEFQLVTENLGNLGGTLGQSVNLCVADFDLNNTLDLLVTSAKGKLRLYRNFLVSPVLVADTTLFRNNVNNNQKVEYWGNGSSIAAADLDGDLYTDIMIGLKSGGISYRRNTTLVPVALEPNRIVKDWNVYPNPAQNQVFISEIGNEKTIGLLYNTTGQLLHRQEIIQNNTAIQLSHLASGIYYLKLQNSQNTQVKKLIINK